MDTRLVHVEAGVELRVIFGDLGLSLVSSGDSELSLHPARRCQS